MVLFAKFIIFRANKRLFGLPGKLRNGQKEFCYTNYPFRHVHRIAWTESVLANWQATNFVATVEALQAGELGTSSIVIRFLATLQGTSPFARQTLDPTKSVHLTFGIGTSCLHRKRSLFVFADINVCLYISRDWIPASGCQLRERMLGY